MEYRNYSCKDSKWQYPDNPSHATSSCFSYPLFSYVCMLIKLSIICILLWHVLDLRINKAKSILLYCTGYTNVRILPVDSTAEMLQEYKHWKGSTLPLLKPVVRYVCFQNKTLLLVVRFSGLMVEFLVYPENKYDPRQALPYYSLPY